MRKCGKTAAALLLCGALLCGSLPAQAATAAQQETVESVVQALEIITGDQDGNLNLSATVTRAEFAKMLVAASPLKDSVSASSNASPFRDVPYTHWSAAYIKAAVSQGWMTGYLDGSFRPGQAVTTAEAATAVLKLLGYSSTDFTGSYPSGQMALYQSLGLSDGISGGAENTMTRGNCMRLFYNLLSVDTKAEDGAQAQKYAVKLGYTLDSKGDPDYNAILADTMDGPVVANPGWASVLPFTPTTVYRNDKQATVNELAAWDVLYYSAERRTVWAYSRRVTGIYEKASPSKESPVSVTVAGKEYTLSGSLAASQLGAGGGLSLGDNITLLFGKDGNVAAAYKTSDLSSVANTDLIGVVTATGSGNYATETGAGYASGTTTLYATDGETYIVPVRKDGITVGNLVRVTYQGDTAQIGLLTGTGSLGGVVDAAAGTIGGVKVAADCDIMEVAGGAAAQIYLSRLDGMTMGSANIQHVEKNAKGEISSLILKDASGDAYSYGIVLGAGDSLSADGGSLTGSYTFLMDGVQSALTTQDQTLNIAMGVSRFEMRDGKVSNALRLTEASGIQRIDGMALTAADGTHTIWDRAAAYVLEDGKYTQIDVDALSLETYSLRAYYDKPDSVGGRVRVLIATKK